jgi:hypothetical protein
VVVRGCAISGAVSDTVVWRLVTGDGANSDSVDPDSANGVDGADECGSAGVDSEYAMDEIRARVEILE